MSNNTDTSDKVYGGGRDARRVLVVLFIIYMSDYADRTVLTSMINFIKADWDISDAKAGWLFSVVLASITVFSLPSAFLVDRWSRRKMIALMTFFWSIATLSCAFAQNYWQLLAARALVGIGEAGYSPGGAALLSAAYPENQRAKVMGLWNAAIPFGVGIGMLSGGLIARKWGWQHAFGLVALPGFILAFFALRLPDYKSARPEQTTSLKKMLPELWRDSKRLLRIRSLTFTYLAFAMSVSCTSAMISWLPAYFERSGSAVPGEGGILASPLFALVLVGAPLGGYLADKWQTKKANARLLLPAWSSVLAGVLLVLAFLLVGHKWAQLSVMGVYGVTVGLFIAPSLAATLDVVHPGYRAMAMGLCVLIQHLVGDIWSPPLIGMLSDHLGDLTLAVFFIPLYCFAAAILFAIASRFYVKDMERVEKVKLLAE